jgi:hypothetical protein
VKSLLAQGLVIHSIIILFSIWKAKRGGETFTLTLLKSVAVLYLAATLIFAYYAYVNVLPAWGSRQRGEYMFAEAIFSVPRFIISLFAG